MARILIYDIETAPILGTAWGKWETNLVWVVKDWYMLSFAYKWLGEKKVGVCALPDYKLYQKDPEDDTRLIQDLYELLSLADVVVAHNGDKFDQKKSNARFLYHGLPPPEPFQSVDTLKVARKYFALTSYKLDDLGDYLKVGHKIKTDKELWKDCMHGDMKAWKKMKKYNQQDVLLLEDVYLKLRPWMAQHPALNVLDRKPGSCGNCGGKMHKGMKYRATNTNLYQYYRCYDCKAMKRSRIPEYKQALDRMSYVS